MKSSRRWLASSNRAGQTIIEMAHRPGVDVQKLRDDAIAYVKNNSPGLVTHCSELVASFV